MKILFVDLYYDYGDKNRGPNNIGINGFMKSLEKLNHEVIPFYYDNYLFKLNELQKLLIKAADNCKPDIIFFILFKNQFKLKTLDYLKSKYTTVNWFGDDTWRFNKFSKNYATHFSWCITTDKFSVDKYKKLGQQNIILSQWATINENKIPQINNNYQYQVSFVGQYHPYRKWFLNKLKKEYGINVEIFGHRWKNCSPVTDKNMIQIFSESKINLNITNSTSLDSSISYLISSPRSIPQTVLSGKTMNQIKARNFEIPYFNGFQLTNYVPSLEDYFHIGKEVTCYTDVHDAALLIKYYLEHNRERETIRENSHTRAISEHGYINRLKLILEQIS